MASPSELSNCSTSSLSPGNDSTRSAPERDNYRAASEIFARAMHVLTTENTLLRKELDRTCDAKVTPIRSI
jgi:hypothetical protein